MLLVVAAIVVSTAVGIWAEHRYGKRAEEATRAMLLGLLYTVVPVLIFFNLARLRIDIHVGGGIALAYVALGITSLAAYAAARYLLRLERPAVGAIVCCTLVANTGFLGYPLTAALLGFDRLGEAVAYDTLVSVPVLLLAGFGVGAAFGSDVGERVRDRFRAFFTRNPALVAAALAIAVPDALAPQVLVDASRIVIIALLPLGFFAVGVYLSDEAEVGELRVPPPLTAPVATVLLTRVALTPAVLFALSAPLIDIPGAYLLEAGMACGINTMVIAAAYGLDMRITSEAVAWSTVVVVAAGLAASLFP